MQQRISELQEEAVEKAENTIDDIFEMENLVFTEDKLFSWEKYSFYARKEYEKNKSHRPTEEKSEISSASVINKDEAGKNLY